jgi:DNA repair exonuclease SbcCD ATPase subunit
MNDDPRIKLLMDSVAKLNDILGGLIKKLEEERQGRVEMCMTIMGFAVLIKNNQNAMARRIADSPLVIGEENSKQEILRNVAQLETVCERLESVIAKAKEPENEQPPDAPSTPGLA